MRKLLISSLLSGALLLSLASPVLAVEDPAASPQPTDPTVLPVQTETVSVTSSSESPALYAQTDNLTFLDVSKQDWFYTYVYDLSKGGVISGHSATVFAPYETLTYGQALKLILLAASYEEQKPTGTHWASGYLSYAVKQGFLSSSQVNLDAPINRLTIAHLAAKALKLPDSNAQTPFTDCNDPAVTALSEKGILQGSTENNISVFKPDGNINRAEISAIIWRIDQLEVAITPTPDPEPTPTPDPTPDPDPTPNPSEKFLYQSKWIDVLPTVPKSPFDTSLFYKEDGFTYYRSDAYTYETGVDVSIYQSDIDWVKVKEAGIDFAIIRVGGRGYGEEGKMFSDNKFKKNMDGALAAGLKVGVYFYSQAISKEEALEEARFVLDAIKGYNVSYPVVFDWEIPNKKARTYGLATETLTAAANAFCTEVQNAGYHPMVYFNLEWGYMNYDLSKIVQYDFWLAQYNPVPTFYYDFDMWQYTDSGQVPGIPGKVDLNLYIHKK